ncbi:SH3 domain protein [Trypanosoma cruzi]|nr:SH3 domain protein [Trypanosoma cruzi]
MQRAPQKELLAAQMAVKKRQWGCRTPLMNAGDGSPIQSATSHHYAQAAHRTADAPPDLSNCPMQSSGRAMELIRKRRSIVVRRNTDIPALGQYEERERGGSINVCAVKVGAENVPSGAIYSLLLHARTADEREELRGLLMAILDVAPSTRLQYARMLRSMSEMNRTPLGMMILGLQKIAARWETKQARPLTEEEMNQVIRSRTDWGERVVFRLAWITASRLFEIASLTPNNFALEPDGNLILDWSVAPKTARADPHRASRFVKIRGQDAFDTIKLFRTLQENEKLTNLTTAHVERALAPWNATAHSIKRGALRHAAEIVETYNLDPHVISQLVKHVNPFDLPQNTVRYVEVHHNADPGVVAGRIDVKGETAEGQ